MAYVSRDQLLTALTDFHEETVTSQWLGGDVLIRELTAYERMMAHEACTTTDENGAPSFNSTWHRGMLLQMMLVDPSTGAPYRDGRIDPRTGQPQIDPRTRAPLFTSDEVLMLIEGREGPVNELLERGFRLSRLLPDSFRNRTESTNGRQRDAGSGAETEPADTAHDARRPVDALDERTAHDDQALGDDGHAVGSALALAVE